MRRLNSKKKFFLVLVGSAILFLLVVKFYLSETYSLYQQNKELRHEISAINASTHSTKTEMPPIDIQRTVSLNKNVDRDFLLQYVADYSSSHKLSIKELPEIHRDTTLNYLLETNKLIVRGGYTDIVKLIYRLEQQDRLGNVVSSDFYIFRDFKTKNKYLQADIYLQLVKEI